MDSISEFAVEFCGGGIGDGWSGRKRLIGRGCCRRKAAPLCSVVKKAGTISRGARARRGRRNFAARRGRRTANRYRNQRKWPRVYPFAQSPPPTADATMRQRMEEIGGKFVVDKQTGQAPKLTAVYPVPRRASDPQATNLNFPQSTILLVFGLERNWSRLNCDSPICRILNWEASFVAFLKVPGLSSVGDYLPPK